MSAGSGWYDAPGVVETFRQLWDAGLSTAAIGRRLGASKNAIVGKSRRLDFPKRPSPIVRDMPPEEAERRRELRNRVYHRTTLPPLESLARKAPPAPPPKVERKPTSRTCQFPTNDKKPFIFCDAPAVEGYPYCEKHNKVCYINYPIKRAETWEYETRWGT
jgi:GcrA cell cycle regulator